MLLEVKNINKNFGGVRAVDDFSMAIDKSTITSIIGPNGAGKTTIFNVHTGVPTHHSRPLATTVPPRPTPPGTSPPSAPSRTATSWALARRSNARWPGPRPSGASTAPP